MPNDLIVSINTVFDPAGITAAESSMAELGATTEEMGAAVTAATEEASVATEGMSGAFEGAGFAAGSAAPKLAEMGASADAAGAETEAAGSAAAESSGGFDLLGGSIAKTIIPLAAMFGLYEGGKAFIGDVKTATDLFQSSNALMTQTLKNTNDAIGMNISQLDALADSTAKGTTITGVSNQAVEQALMGYSAINKKSLPESISLVDDLATRMAKGGTPSTQQLTQASKALGKALEDPATGITAFTRQMVNFTPAQVAAVKAMEKAGNTAGAQALEMQDLATVVGGDATAATNTFSGKLAELKAQMDPLEVEFGQKFYAALTKIGMALEDEAIKLIPLAEKYWPKLKQAGEDALNGLKLAFDYVKPGLEILKNDIETIAKAIIKVAEEAWPTFESAIKIVFDYLNAHKKDVADFITVFLLFFEVFNPIIDIAILVALNFKKISTTLSELKKWFDGNSASIKFVKEAFKQIRGELEILWDDIKSKLLPALENLWNTLGPPIKVIAAIIGVVLDAAIQIIIVTLDLLVRGLALVSNAIADVIKWIESVISWFENLPTAVNDAWDKVLKWTALYWNKIKDAVKDAWNATVTWLSSVWTDITTPFVTAYNWVINLFKGMPADIGKAISGTGSTLVTDIENGFKGITGAAGSILSKIGLASGGSFIVPQGFPNDSYPLGGGVFAQSGEKVTVTPAGQTSNSSQVVINQNNNFSTPQDPNAIARSMAFSVKNALM
jgi:hypothetical protein